VKLKPWHVSGLIALGLAAFVGGSTLPLSAGAPGAPDWLSDYDAAQSIGRESGKPLFVAFR
jgi:hypothetical protein